jgi:hypothetical protein
LPEALYLPLVADLLIGADAGAGGQSLKVVKCASHFGCQFRGGPISYDPFFNYPQILLAFDQAFLN